MTMLGGSPLTERWFQRLVVLTVPLVIALIALISELVDQDECGKEVAGAVPLHIVRHIYGTTITFQSVSRNPETNEVTLRGVFADVRSVPKFVTTDWKPCFFVKVYTSNPRIFEGQLVDIRGVQLEFPFGRSFPILNDVSLVCHLPQNADTFHWSITLPTGSASTADWSRTETMTFTTPNPGKNHVSNGFKITPRTESFHGVEFSLSSYNLCIPNTTAFHGHSFQDFYQWITDKINSWGKMDINAPSPEIYLNVESSNPDWNNHEFQETSGGVSDYEPKRSSGTNSCYWPEDGPYQISSLWFHTGNFSSPGLDFLVVPKAGKEIAINTTLRFGKSWIYIEKIKGPSSKYRMGSVLLSYSALRLKVDLVQGQSGFGQYYGGEFTSPADVYGIHHEEMGLDSPLGGINPSIPFSIRGALADAGHAVTFVASPTIVYEK